MACTQIITSIAKDCSGNVGGVKEVYIANKSAVDADLFELDEEGVFYVQSGWSGGKVFTRLEMPRGAATFGTTAQINRETGANYFDNAVTVVVNKLRNGTAALLKALVLGEFVALVRDNNDVAHLVGYGLNPSSNSSEGAMATDGSSTTGTALTDANRETVTLAASESEPAPTASWSVISEDFLAYVS